MTRPVWIALVAALAMGTLALWLAQPERLRKLPSANSTRSERSSQTDEIKIRVRLAGPSDKVRRIRIEGPYQVVPMEDWRVFAQGDKLPEVEVASTDQGIRIGGEDFPARSLRIAIHRDGALWVENRRYRGNLLLGTSAQGELLVINELPLEQYLASVLPSEMPGNFPEAAQQAQTIVARSYAIYHRKTLGQNRAYDVSDTTASQRYGGVEYLDPEKKRLFAVESAASRQIVNQTRGMVLLYRQRIFCSYYGAVCGGHTASGISVFGQAAPPLVGVTCSGCAAGPNYRWQKTFPLEEVESRLNAYLSRRGQQLGRIEAIEIDSPGKGILPILKISGSEITQSMAADVFRRRALGSGTPSSFYTVKLHADTLEVNGRGWGHCVGLCQWGARGYAQQGMSAPEILSHYYPGTRIAIVE